MDTDRFGPEHIRTLRGSQSRAAFARTLGVTPQTIYRWELPGSAKESRRPRGAERARLEAFADGGSPPPRRDPPLALPAVPSSAPQPLPPLPPMEEDLSLVLPSLERIFHGDPRRGHGELIQLVATNRRLSPNARAAASFGIATFELVQRSDVRAASIAIAPALSDAEAGRLGNDVAAKVYSIAAMVHAWADAMLFDLGRVHAYAARVEAIATPSDHEAACLACLATLCAATMVGDLELLERAFVKLDETRWYGLPPLLAIHVEEFRTMKVMLAGRVVVSSKTYEAVAADAERQGYPLVLSRTLARLALCQLDNLADPERVLLIARRAKAVAGGARVGPGMHQIHALRAEIEALLRLGRAREALAVLAELDAWSADTGLPPLSAITVETRLLSLTGETDKLTALSTHLRECEVPALRPICLAYARHVEAQAHLLTANDPEATIALFERAELEASRWPYLLREVLLHRTIAHAAAADAASGRVALRRAQRYVDGFPSAWFTAQLRRLEGAFFAANNQWNEGRQLMESAIATFELAHDRCDAATTRYLLALLSNFFEGPRPEAVEAAQKEMTELGIVPPPSMLLGTERFAALHREQHPDSMGGRPSIGVDQLVVPLRRVSVRGASPNLILRELVSVVSGLFPARRTYLEELDSAGVARPVFGSAPAERAEVEWVEFGDGAGRVLRLGVTGPVAQGERAGLSILVTTASLALETATLRSFGEREGPMAADDRSPELPGFVAASAEMRKLRAEIVRLSSSQATVIITGESGAGKEVVARAIHDLSERSGNSYVAFNCATVPRDLFEGQLFGYRRGAFTGAASDQPGVIRAANGGTLFLDEIGELPLDIQPKLLRFLENGEVFPLGERKPVRVDVRILSATHRDLAALVREGRFREDLYYRLQVVPLHVPPLRERREDIPVLARHFVRDLSRHGEPPVLAPDAISALLAYRWPGNVRELRNVVERVLAFSPAPEVLRAEHLRLPTAPLA